MLVSAISLVTFAFVAMLVIRRLGRRVPSYAAVPVIAAGAGVMVLGWIFSGIGGLALDILKHMILPVATLTLISFAGTMLLTRNSMLETIREDYVMAARAKGLPESQVRDRHAARNAMLPVITSLVYSLIFAIDGSVIIEVVFSWPGMGLTLLEAVRSETSPWSWGRYCLSGSCRCWRTPLWTCSMYISTRGFATRDHARAPRPVVLPGGVPGSWSRQTGLPPCETAAICQVLQGGVGDIHGEPPGCALADHDSDIRPDGGFPSHIDGNSLGPGHL